ncbi:FadR/GntR family transcriptional regulator [Pseudophaeobacter sp.]|uniref:FadR/GntR family transcriptional regulator n=1 Tax=Pseudophaeobacter sp. TaxID=1971739 RepID=UPI0040585EE6
MKPDALPRLRSWLGSEARPEGFRLPPERELAPLLGVSRTDLRNALLVLEAEGGLERQVGRGTFLRHAARPGTDYDSGRDISSLAERTGPMEAMNARLALEPELAQMAALQASPLQISELRELAQAMQASPDWASYEKQDAEFHDLLAKSAGNPLLYELHRIVNGVRLVVVWRRLNPEDVSPPSSYHSFAEHDAIVAALERRDQAAARAAMRAHLAATIAAMTGGA